MYLFKHQSSFIHPSTHPPIYLASNYPTTLLTMWSWVSIPHQDGSEKITDLGLTQPELGTGEKKSQESEGSQHDIDHIIYR